ncbi:MAG: DUF4397 domain-containing protein [Planctomycetota bacterium]
MTATCFALVSALVLAQAGGEKKDQPPVPAPAAMAKVIFVHASPDAAPTVDVYVNGEKKVPGLAYGKPSKMTDLAAGDANVEFKAGDKALGTAATLKLVGNKQYTIAATGKAAEVKYQLIEAKATAGKAHVIFFHASPDAGSVDVKADGKDWTKGLAMGKSFDAAMEAGKHKFDLMVGSAEPALTKELDLKADMCYCVFATGTKTTPKLELVVAEHAMAVKKPT